MPRILPTPCHPTDPSLPRQLYINPRVPAARRRMLCGRTTARQYTLARALICRRVYIRAHETSKSTHYSYVDASRVILLEKPPSTLHYAVRALRPGYTRYVASALIERAPLYFQIIPNYGLVSFIGN